MCQPRWLFPLFHRPYPQGENGGGNGRGPGGDPSARPRNDSVNQWPGNGAKVMPLPPECGFPRGATIILEMDLAGRNKRIATVGAWSGQPQDHPEQGIPCSRAKRNCLPGPRITYCCLLPPAFAYCY